MNNQPKQIIETRKAGVFGKMSSWVDALTYPQKFIIITLFFLLPLIAFTPLISEQSTYIQRYGYREAEGTIYLRDLRQTKNDFQALRSTMNEYLLGSVSLADVEEVKNNVEGSILELENTSLKYSETLSLNFKVNDLKAQWQTIKDGTPSDSLIEEIINLETLLDAATKEVGDVSYLILDPDLDTYYMMDTVLLNMPESQKVLFDLFLVSDRAIRNQVLTPEDESQLEASISLLENNLANLERNIQTTTQNNASGEMRPLIDAPSQNYINTALAFSNTIKAGLTNGGLQQLTPEELGTLFKNTRQASNDFYKGASEALLIGIQGRITRLSTRLYTTISIVIVSVLVAFVIGISIMRAISTPLEQLSTATKRISSGEMFTRIPIKRNDEIGEVARAFNQMAQELQEERSEAESRTRELEIANQKNEKRAAQFQAIANVASATATLQDQEQTLTQVTQTISQQLGHYHVGIFLVDESRKYAILKSTNSEGGNRMLERGHQLEVGAAGIVGFVASQGKPRIALDTGSDAVYFNNPDLPETRSEVALPLMQGNEVIGVLDVQSTLPRAFTADDIDTLSILASQVSITIQNTRLYEENMGALQNVEKAYRELSGEIWKDALKSQSLKGYIYDGIRSGPLKQTIATEHSIAIPVNVRGHNIGSIKLSALDPDREWSEDELTMITAAADRAALALDGARLLADSQKRAAKERAIGEITAKISAQSEVDKLIQTATQELGRALSGMDISIQLTGDDES